jgi:hypothetical protein
MWAGFVAILRYQTRRGARQFYSAKTDASPPACLCKPITLSETPKTGWRNTALATGRLFKHPANPVHPVPNQMKTAQKLLLRAGRTLVDYRPFLTGGMAIAVRQRKGKTAGNKPATGWLEAAIITLNQIPCSAGWSAGKGQPGC